MVISKQTIEGLVWRSVCESWALLESADLHVLQQRMPPDTHELLHLHQKVRQLYFVLEGEASVRFEDRVERVRPAEAVRIEPGEAHQMRNDSSEPLEFLVISSAPPRSDRVELEGDAA